MCVNVQLEVLGDDYHATCLLSFHMYFELKLAHYETILGVNLVVADK